MMRWILVPLLAMLIGGCSKDPAAYLISGSQVSITIERIKPNFWTKGWDLDLVARQHPNCQRRYHLKHTNSSKVRVDVYSPQRGIFILRQGKRWYVTDLRTCAFDTFADPPPAPGELMGSFMEKDGMFKFVQSGGRASAPDRDAEAD